MNMDELVSLTLRREQYEALPHKPKVILKEWISKWNNVGDVRFTIPRKILVAVSKELTRAA